MNYFKIYQSSINYSKLKDTSGSSIHTSQREFKKRRFIKINLGIILSCPNIQGNNRYNIYILFSIQYQDCGVKNVKNLVLS